MVIWGKVSHKAHKGHKEHKEFTPFIEALLQAMPDGWHSDCDYTKM